jgi:hypothetical protein
MEEKDNKLKNSESSDSEQEDPKEVMKRHMEKVERMYIRVFRSVGFLLGYFLLSRYFLNWISRRFWPEDEIVFRWNIIEFAKNFIV